ncbi:deoxyribodipyrimidine photo-lyase [Aliidiomarina indica]|uniref:deoxyribodipyrimidine photo-lyase n=1 Tax=Aliidiomarina indica TaxID=2749147 RepID=UPI0018909DC2|nr:deoxyribodipyrimidine photo-lyase [Aliidiomarina indica]
MVSNTTALVWLRNDLRLLDNDAVYAAATTHKHCEFIVVRTPETWRNHDWAPIKWSLYHRHLQTLADDLAERGYQLQVHTVTNFSESVDCVLKYAKQVEASSIYINREYPVHEMARDKRLAEKAQAANIELITCDSQLLVAPERIQSGSGSYYRMFTPFFRAWKDELTKAGVPRPYQRSVLEKRDSCKAPKIDDSVPEDLPGRCRNSEDWPVGEAKIRQRVSDYVRDKASAYHKTRDVPSEPGTSKLSPYWEIGAISPRIAAHFLQKQSPEFPAGLSEGMHTWLSELAWREFYQHLMFHVPRLSKHKPFQQETDAYPWRDDQDHYNAWCEGRTGYPIVDAGMRQLAATGWMHNRVRMIVANFLTKDLHIDWRLGERWFMQNLIDGSFPANNGGWQWSASTGTDAVPYFRVFNPTRQSEKVDPKGAYIRTWVEELAEVPDKHIHEPHGWLKQHDQNTTYPAPIVDHKHAREIFIANFKQVKNG